MHGGYITRAEGMCVTCGNVIYASHVMCLRRDIFGYAEYE